MIANQAAEPHMTGLPWEAWNANAAAMTRFATYVTWFLTSGDIRGR